MYSHDQGRFHIAFWATKTIKVQTIACIIGDPIYTHVFLDCLDGNTSESYSGNACIAAPNLLEGLLMRRSAPCHPFLIELYCCDCHPRPRASGLST